MELNGLMLEGLRLLAIGMGIVFSFLIVLVFAMKGMSWLAFKLGGEPDDAAPPPARAQVAATTDNSALVAVISAAVSRYRQNRR